MDIAVSEILSTLGAVFPGFAGRIIVGVLFGLLSGLGAVRFLGRHPSSQKSLTDETECLRLQASENQHRFLVISLVVLGLAFGLVAGASLGVRHAYTVTIEECPAVRSRISEGTEFLADFVYTVNILIRKGALSADVSQAELNPWREGKARFRPAELSRKPEEFTAAYARWKASVLKNLPERTHFLAKCFLPDFDVARWVDEYNEIFPDASAELTRAETMSCLRRYLLEDGLTATVKRKTSSWLVGSIATFLIGALLLIGLSRRN